MRIVFALFLMVGCGGVEGGDPGAALHASDGGSVDAGPMTGKLGASCTTNDDCDSKICNDYPAKGGYRCSNTCTSSTEAVNCPAPATGCNMMGFCKF